MTDRYTKAIEQLGSEKLDVRIGGIYALERIARDSARDHPTVIEVLSAFIREHSHEQWPPPGSAGVVPERSTHPDIQASLTVVGRREPKRDIQILDLPGVNLNKANLGRARLAGANLWGVDFTGAYLNGVYLNEAFLADACFAHASLGNAHLLRANLSNTDLTKAWLPAADLTEADLTGADLTGALLSSNAVVPEGWQRDAGSGLLKRADTSSGG